MVALNFQVRAQLLNTRAAAERVDVKIDNMRRMNNESEEIGTNVAVRLRQQREQLLHARDGIDRVDAVVNQAKTVMSRMGRRVVTDKLIQGSIILMELVIIGVIVYIKFIRS